MKKIIALPTDDDFIIVDDPNMLLISSGQNRFCVLRQIPSDEAKKLGLVVTKHIVDMTKSTPQLKEEACLGEGSFGEVFVGCNVNFPSVRLAIKKMIDVEEAVMKNEFKLQQQAAKANDGVVRVHDFICTVRPYVGWLVFDLADVSLHDAILGKRLSVPNKIEIAYQIGEALIKCHQNGVAHRDIKLSNILLFVSEGVIKARLADFGIAVDATVRFLEFKGSLTNMAPEIRNMVTSIGFEDELEDAEAFKHYRECDAFSFGVLILDMMNDGHVLAALNDKFDHDEIKDVLGKRLSEQGAEVKALVSPLVSMGGSKRNLEAAVKALGAIRTPDGMTFTGSLVSRPAALATIFENYTDSQHT